MYKQVKKVTVDGEDRAELWEDGKFVKDVDLNSQLSFAEAKRQLLSE